MADSTTARCGMCSMVWDHFTLVTRIWGILTAVGLWGIGIETTHKGTHVAIGLYLIFSAIIVTFFETLFLLDPIAKKCCSEESCPNKCWTSLAWIDNWKRGILYVLLSIVCFLKPESEWMAVVSGIMLLISAVFHGLHTIKDVRESNMKGIANENYGRFREVEDDDMDAPLGGASRTSGDTHNVHNIEPLFQEGTSDRAEHEEKERETRYNPFGEERKELKRSNSFDLGTGSDALTSDAHATGTLEI